MDDVSLILYLRLGFGLVIGLLLLTVVCSICRTCHDLADAQDGVTTYASRNQSKVNRNRIHNDYPEIRVNPPASNGM